MDMMRHSDPMVASAPPLRTPPAKLLWHASLFLDFDGTLVELAERPDAVRVDMRLPGLIRQLHERLHGRVALISGRSAARLRAMLGADVRIVGSHGMEFMAADGTVAPFEQPSALAEIETAMSGLTRSHPGTLVEVKPLGVALHFRKCPSAEAACVGLASSLAERHELHLQPGKMMIEVRAGGGDKGTAIRTLMREPDMIGTRPVFMGDDLTDEPGFVAAQELSGTGILVGEQRTTAARYGLDDVEATLAWLEAASAEVA
jgi:trehalose 6-phosphate phosphatase